MTRLSRLRITGALLVAILFYAFMTATVENTMLSLTIACAVAVVTMVSAIGSARSALRVMRHRFYDDQE